MEINNIYFKDQNNKTITTKSINVKINELKSKELNKLSNYLDKKEFNFKIQNGTNILKLDNKNTGFQNGLMKNARLSFLSKRNIDLYQLSKNKIILPDEEYLKKKLRESFTGEYKKYFLNNPKNIPCLFEKAALNKIKSQSKLIPKSAKVSVNMGSLNLNSNKSQKIENLREFSSNKIFSKLKSKDSDDYSENSIKKVNFDAKSIYSKSLTKDIQIETPNNRNILFIEDKNINNSLLNSIPNNTQLKINISSVVDFNTQGLTMRNKDLFINDEKGIGVSDNDSYFKAAKNQDNADLVSNKNKLGKVVFKQDLIDNTSKIDQADNNDIKKDINKQKAVYLLLKDKLKNNRVNSSINFDYKYKSVYYTKIKLASNKIKSSIWLNKNNNSLKLNNGIYNKQLKLDSDLATAKYKSSSVAKLVKNLQIEFINNQIKSSLITKI